MKFTPSKLGIKNGCNIYITGVIFLASIFYFCFGIFFGIDFTDSFYHINKAQDPVDGVFPFTFFLSSILIQWIMNVVGDELIILRFVHSFCLVFSVFIPFIIVRPKISLSKIFLFCSLVLVLFAPLNFNILSYDSFSLFVLSLIFAVLILFFKKRKLFQIVLLAILVTISILLRLPNILFVPLIFLFLHSGRFKSWKNGYSFLLLVTLFAAGAYYMYYNNFHVFSNSSVSFPLAKFKLMVARYLRDGLTLVAFTVFLSLSYLAFLYLEKKSKILAYITVIIVLSCFVWWFILFTDYAKHYAFLLSSICLSFILINLIKGRTKEQTISLLFLTFMILYPIGSDTGLLKSCTIFLLFPFLYCTNNSEGNRFWILILVLLIPFSILEKLYGTYEEELIYKLDTTVELPGLYPIKTSEKRYMFLKEIDLKVKDLREKGFQVYFYGNKSHIFHYLYPGSDLNLKSFYQPVNDLSLYGEMEKELIREENTAVFLIDTYPEDGEVLENSLIGDQLEKLGYWKVSNNFFILYEN